MRISYSKLKGTKEKPSIMNEFQIRSGARKKRRKKKRSWGNFNMD